MAQELAAAHAGRSTWFDHAFAWVYERGTGFFVPAVLVLTIVKYGIGLIPSWNRMEALAINWRTPLVSPLLQPPGDFRLRTPVSAVLAGWLHLTGPRAFIGFHFVLALLAIVTPFLMPAVRRGADLRLTVGLLLVGGAIPAVLIDWVGSYDPVSIGAAAVAALARRREVAAVAWAVFAFNNAPEAFFALLFTAVIYLLHERAVALWRLIPYGAGALVGYILIRVVDHNWGGGTSEFSLFKFYGFARYYTSAWHFWPLIVFSALGVGWLLFTAHEVFELPAARALVACSVLGSFTIPLFALDETRLTAGILWAPVLVTAAIVVDVVDTGVLLERLRRIAPVALLIVVVVVWDGALVYPGWHSIVSFVQYLDGARSIPHFP